MASLAAGAGSRRSGQLLRTRRTRAAVLVWCFLLPSLAIFLLYRILPLAWNVWLSFHDWAPLREATFIGLENYEEMLIWDDVFWTALWNTLIFIASIYPARIVTGWAYHRATMRPAHITRDWRWMLKRVVMPALSLALMLPLLGLYVFLLYFTQFIGEHGKAVLFEHHALLLPVPF